ncbi:transporter substrate-binding domain-containing protein [Pseudomonas sp. nanlin1]|uniref:transporter substrate-binding domain-containing protein n=1 Tax=Pseudomonas sp. nanlin1 TaxID=3040605 RepID=UPI00388EA862
MRTNLACLRALGLSLTLACSAAFPVASVYAQDESGLARIERTKTLRIGVISGAIPYFSKNLGSGAWSGFGPDFAKSLGDSLGAKVAYVETTWGNAVLDLQSNKIDVMFGMAPTPARRDMLNFSDNLFNNTYTTVCKQGYPYKDWKQLNDPAVRIAVDVGSSHDNFATAKLPQASVSRLENSGAATMALQAGKVDCQILVVLLAQPLLSKRPDIGTLHIPEPVLSAPVSIGMQKEADPGLTNAVNHWIAQEKQSGQIKQVILDNMEKLAGVKADAFPKNVQF